MAYGPVNVPGVSEAEAAAAEQAANDAKEAAQGVSNKVGATGDTGGSASAGSVFAKLNKLISDLSTHMGRWTATRAGYIDTIKSSTDTIKTDAAAAKADAAKIGATGDTGGSATAGTVMGKLNRLISDMATHVSSWNSTRAGYIDSIKSNTDTIKSSTDRIGAANDTGGSTTAGSVMAKLNKLITDLTSHASSWNSTRAGYIDTIKSNTDTIKSSTDRIGATGDTGGTATAGTVMGKLNKLISDLSTHMGRWTATRAGYIDTINTNAASAKADAAAAKTDAAAAKANTATNNTGSSTGTLSQKLSYIISQLSSGTAKMGAVKSVQRGVATLGGYSGTGGSIDINTVDPDKCLVILNGMYGSSGMNTVSAYLSSITANKLTIGIDTNQSTKCSWQVIEYY